MFNPVVAIVVTNVAVALCEALFEVAEDHDNRKDMFKPLTEKEKETIKSLGLE